MVVGWSSKEGALGFEIYGSKGTIIVDYVTPLKIWTEGNPTWQVIDNVAGGGWDTEISHFIECLLDGTQPKTSGEDGKIALEVALAVYRANEEGKNLRLEA
jgi:predicted dehydrogenase